MLIELKKAGLFNTKKEVLNAIGSEENWSDVQKYFNAKRSISKEVIK